MHCDVWNGFIFINFDDEPRQSLREFLGPMITGLDDYPFGKLTERYEWVAHNNSNWKIFADAFQEYYHVPSLHSQQVPSEVRDPNAGFTCGHFQLDGPHRLVSTAGRRRWLLPPEYMYPIERATRSGLVGPWRTPDIGELPAAGLNPGRDRAVGDQQLPDLPQHRDPDLWRLVSACTGTGPPPTTPTASRPTPTSTPPRSVRERIEHEVAAVVLKEFALQDAGMLGGTQAALEYGIVDDFPLNDQEILVRHLHKVVVDWVSAYRREHCPGGSVTHARSPAAQRVRRTGEVRPNLVSGNRNRALERPGQRVDAGAARLLRRVLPAPGRGHRLLRQVHASTACPTTRSTCCT